MYEIATVSFTEPTAPASFTRSLHETGFAVLRDHPVTAERIDALYALWATFFASQQKHDWLQKPDTQGGYFPFRSENAKDHPVKDLKEFYHVYENGPVPAELAEATLSLHADLVTLGSTLLRWLQENSPASVTGSLTEPMPSMIENSDRHLLRVLHYPKLDEAPEPGAVRAAAHGDINLVTCLVAGSAPGLEAQDTAGRWHAVPCDPGMMAINAGDMLDVATDGYFPATVHRVVNPPAENNEARFSMPMFLHARADVELRDGLTADAFLTQRLREIGLVE